MMTAPNAAPKNIATTASTLLANLGLFPFAIEESAPIPVIVSVKTVVVRSGGCLQEKLLSLIFCRCVKMLANVNDLTAILDFETKEGK